MRIVGHVAVMMAAALAAAMLAFPTSAHAERSGSGAAMSLPAAQAATEFSDQRRWRRRAPVRIRVYPAARTPAFRQCASWYVEEPRPSGTVITPRMQCWWSRR